MFPLDTKFVNMEREYRQKKIYGDRDREMKSIV